MELTSTLYFQAVLLSATFVLAGWLVRKWIFPLYCESLSQTIKISLTVILSSLCAYFAAIVYLFDGGSAVVIFVLFASAVVLPVEASISAIIGQKKGDDMADFIQLLRDELHDY